MHSQAQDHFDHGHDYPTPENFSLSFFVAVSANISFTILEAFYAFLTDSASLLADAGHNFSDVVALLLAWGASFLATRATSQLYSYGLRRTTILAALVNALILVLTAGFIGLQALDKLMNPSPISETTVMVVAAVGILVNAGTALMFRKDSDRDLNIKAAYLHLAYDALISIGVVISAALIFLTGWLWIDGLTGCLIVGVIIWGAWGLLRDSVNLILDAVPRQIDRQQVLNYLQSIDGVDQVHDLHIWALSAKETCLTAHLVMPEKPLWESESAYRNIDATLKQRFGIYHVTLQVEKNGECVTQDCN